MNPLSIFIVDDNQDFAESLADILELDGHTVELAFDGETAVKKFRDQEFDITFLDVKLPGMNGVESFFEIRKINPQAKVVMMTGYSIEQLLNQAVENGAIGVLHKPVEIPKLLDFLEKVKPAGIILLADDDPDFVSSLKEVLVNQNYRVIVVNTGQDAVDRILATKVDVLILDLKLPVLNGLEVYLTLKELDQVVPTIIITAYVATESDSISSLRSMSVAGFFAKPFNPQEMLDAIRLITTQEN